jgi:hypothetical protein
MRNRATVIVALTLVFCTTMTFGQAPSAPQKPGPEVKKLGVFVGKWKVVGDVKSGGGMGPGGKVTGAATCEWIFGGFGVLCDETATIPGGMGELRDVVIIGYDADAKQYVLTQVTNPGYVWKCLGSVDGDTWTWFGEQTGKGKTYFLRFTMKWMSKDSYDFKNEIGPNADSMTVMMDGKETRATAPSAEPAPK